jgi:hypothetical protein
MGEGALRKDIDRAHRAESLLNDDLIKEAFETLSRDYRTAWLATGARDTDARERLWIATTIVNAVKSHLENVIRGGVLAKAELDAVTNDPNQRRKLFGVI